MPLSSSQRLDSFDDLLLYRLSRLLSVAGSTVVRLCEGTYGITRREWRIIGLLHGQAGLTPSALADRVQLDRARTSRTISALVAKKLIERTPAPGDRRGARLALTEAGRDLYEELMPQVVGINNQLLEALQEGEVRLLDDLLDRLQQRSQQLSGMLHPELPKANRHLGRRGRS